MEYSVEGAGFSTAVAWSIISAGVSGKDNLSSIELILLLPLTLAILQLKLLEIK